MMESVKVFIKRWLKKNRFKQFKERHFDLSTQEWSITHNTLRELVNVIVGSDLTDYSPRSGSKIRIRVAHPNIYIMLDLLDEAINVLNEDGDVPKSIQKPRNNETLYSIRLDDYLVTNENVPLKPKEFINVLHSLIQNLSQALDKVKGKNPRKHDYYVRQFTHLIEEIFEVLLGIVEADENARKQRSRKDVIL